MTTKRWAGLLLAACALTAGPVAGVPEAQAYSKAVTQKCRNDYKRLCPAYKTASAELRACMSANHRAISNSCMNALVDAGEAPPGARRR